MMQRGRQVREVKNSVVGEGGSGRFLQSGASRERAWLSRSSVTTSSGVCQTGVARRRPLALGIALVLGGGGLHATSVMGEEASRAGVLAQAVASPAAEDGNAVDGVTGERVLSQGAPAASSTLPAVTVRDQRMGATTEGTGRYAASQASRSTGLRLSPRETPQTVTVITRQQMDDRGVQTIRDALSTTTGIVSNNDWMRPEYFARGMTIDNIMVDGMPMLPGYQSVAATQMDEAVAYDRLEVIRGANGLLSGTGEPSAAVNIHRKRATRHWQGHVGGSVGSWDAWKTEADVSGPLNADGSVRGRVAGSLGDADHYIDHAGRRSKALFATLEADLSRDTTARLGYQQDVWRLYGVNIYSAVPLFHDDGQPMEAPRSLATTPRNWWSDQKARAAFAGVEQKLADGWTLDAQVEHTRRRVTNQPTFKLGWDGGFFPTREGRLNFVDYGYTPYPVKDDQWGYSLNAQGPFRLLGREHELSVGLNGFSYHRRVLGWRLQDNYLPDAYYTDATLWNMADRGVIQRYEFSGHDINQRRVKQVGLWMAARWNLADSVKLISGARITRHHEFTDRYDEETGALRTGHLGEQRFGHEVVPYLGLTWDFSPDWTAYASHTDIFKPTGAVNANDESLPPEKGKSYELGMKGAFHDGRLQASVAVFRAVKDDVAVVDPSYPQNYLTPGGNTPYRSAGKGNESRGIELELTGELRPGWQVQAGYTYATLQDAEGRDLIRNQPKHLLRLFTSHRLRGALQGVSVGGGLSWLGHIQHEVDRPTGAYDGTGAPVVAPYRFRQKGVALADLMLRYQATKQLSLSLNVDNLFDRKYYSAISSFDTSAIWGTPRRVRVAVRHDF